MIQNACPDIYSDENGVLKNRLGIRDKEVLEAIAGSFSEKISAKISALPIMKITRWDADFYRQLHRALLGDVYPWAGEYRKMDVGISYDNVAYEPWQNVEAKTREVFDFINEKNLFKGCSNAEKIVNLSLVFGTLKNLQPFRDGNTRTALFFTEILARQSGMAIDYSLVGKEEFALAQIKSRDGDPTPLALMFTGMTAPSHEMPHIHAPRVFADGKDHDLLEQIELWEKWQIRDRESQEASKGQRKKPLHHSRIYGKTLKTPIITGGREK